MRKHAIFDVRSHTWTVEGLTWLRWRLTESIRLSAPTASEAFFVFVSVYAPCQAKLAPRGEKNGHKASQCGYSSSWNSPMQHLLHWAVHTVKSCFRFKKQINLLLWKPSPWDKAVLLTVWAGFWFLKDKSCLLSNVLRQLGVKHTFPGLNLVQLWLALSCEYMCSFFFFVAFFCVSSVAHYVCKYKRITKDKYYLWLDWLPF